MPSPWSRPWLRVRGLVAAMAVAGLLGAVLLGSSLAAPSGVAGMGPLPACRYDDILTKPRAYDDWSITLVDTILRVTKDYVPPDLVPVSDAGIGGTGKVRSIAVSDLRAMTLAAKAAGNPIAVESSYRSYQTQVNLFQAYVDRDGYKKALTFSARPGHSEHQLGVAIDFRSAGGGSPFGGDWGKTAAGTWMRRHAWEYGWVLSYPTGKVSGDATLTQPGSITCYVYEPWHYRYVGRDLAAKIHASGLTPRQYLWAHFTTAVVPPPSTAPGSSGHPVATASPSIPASVGPSPSVSPSEMASASPEASPSSAPSLAAPSPTWASSASPAPAPASNGSAIDPATAVAVVGLVIGLAAVLAAIAYGRRRSRSGPGL